VSDARPRTFFLVLCLFAAAYLFSQEPVSGVDMERMRWEKDFELLLEIAGVPTRGQVELEQNISSLEKERESLLRKRDRLSARLDRLNSSYISDQLYDEMLEEETMDLSSTKKSISSKLETVEERLGEIEDKLRKLYPERTG